MYNTSAILLFVKQPLPGQVKSRISAALGQDVALSLYRNLLLDALDQAERTGMAVHLCVLPPDAIPDMSTWLGSDRTYLPQEGADLGQRMEQAFRAIFAQGVERAVLIGSDLPDLPSEILHQATHALERHDAVIGPARDGGYYLIGFRKDGFVPEVFQGMAWSQPDVFERTLQLFHRASTSLHVLPPWQDVDTIEDLRDLVRRNERTAFADSRTMRYLETIRDRLFPAEEHYGEVRL